LNVPKPRTPGRPPKATRPDILRSAGAQRILESFPDGAVTVFDHALRFVDAGGAGLAALGFSRSAVEGKTLFEVFSSETSLAIEPVFQRALDGVQSDIELSDRESVALLRVSPIRNSAGRVIAGICFTQDVTAARGIRRALREAEGHFLIAFDSSPIGSILLGLDGAFQRVNPAMCRLTGHDDEHLRTLTFSGIIHPDDLQDQSVGLQRLLSGARDQYISEARYVAASGTVFQARTVASLLRREDGTPLQVIAQVQPITDSGKQDEVLADERRRLHDAQVIGRVGSWELTVDTDLLTWSDSLFEIFGLDRTAFSGHDGAGLDCVHPDDRSDVQAATLACKTTGQPFRLTYRIRRSNDGVARWVESRGEAVFEDGVVVRVVGAVVDVTDVTERVQLEAQEFAVHTFQQAIIKASPDFIFVYDVANMTTVWTDPSLVELLGYDPEDLEAMGTDIFNVLVPESDWATFMATLGAAADVPDGDLVQLNHRLSNADGSIRWFSQRTTPLRRAYRGTVVEVVASLRDITDAVAIEKDLEHSALHDQLTGLPNRALLIDRLKSALARSQRDGREVAVLFCDLDGFKRVNDTAGHRAGDAVLLETAGRLASCMRAGDTVARVGGDEFVIIIEPWNRTGSDHEDPNPAHDREIALHVARRIAAVVREPICIDDVEHVITCSIGVTYGQVSLGGLTGGVTADVILQDADAAMYRAKNHGKDRFEVFEPSLRTDLTERGRVEQVLRRALGSAAATPIVTSRKRDRSSQPIDLTTLTAAYQPVFDAETGALVSFEALARLTNDDGLSISPEVFIAVAESTGIIRSLGQTILNLACEQLAAWRAEMPGLLDNVKMAVNMSPIEARYASHGDDVRQALALHNLAPTDLILEMTETALLQAAHSTIKNMGSLQADGVGIAIDDFGTGYASLRYLAILPVSAVKIDQSFTAGLPTDETSMKIVKAVVGLAADMGLDCIVEGVETEEQRRALPRGVQLQGWLTGRPLSGQTTDLTDLLTKGRPDTPLPHPRAEIAPAPQTNQGSS
jgi:diguanylate cyclase (GGDEF)-like protein/PAS domain S-box-containing protein